MPAPAKGGAGRDPRATTFALGPFRGVRREPVLSGPTPPDALTEAVNIWRRPGQDGITWRPGFVQNGAGVGASVTNAYTGVWMVLSDGTTRVFWIGEGKVWRMSTADLSLTDVTPVGVTIKSTGRIYACQFGDDLIVSDGVNRPWRGTNLGGTPITGAYLDINGAATGVAFGAPVVYAGKLFFITNADRTKIVWSEEGDSTIGYEQSGYANFWRLIQTDSRPLTALFATNSALYYFRTQGIGVIAGQVSAEFSTTATADAISEDVGVVSPASVTSVGRTLYFQDQRARAWKLEGTDLTPIWRDLPRRFLFAANLTADRNFTVASADMGVVVFSMNAFGQLVVWSHDTQAWLDLWAVVNTSIDVGTVAAAYGGVDGPDGTYWMLANGRVAKQAVATFATVDVVNGVTTQPRMRIILPIVGDSRAYWLFDRLEMLGSDGAPLSFNTWSVGVQTDQSVAITPAVTATGTSGFNFPIVGLRRHARWIAVALESNLTYQLPNILGAVITGIRQREVR